MMLIQRDSERHAFQPVFGYQGASDELFWQPVMASDQTHNGTVTVTGGGIES